MGAGLAKGKASQGMAGLVGHASLGRSQSRGFLHGRLQVHRALVGDLAAENSGACEDAWVACEGSELRQRYRYAGGDGNQGYERL